MNRVCVVTGSSSGIGAATARLFAENGWNVGINFSREAGPAEDVARACREKGSETIVIRADVSADSDCRRFASEINAKWGRCDVLVNNAGTTKFVEMTNLDGLTADDFQRIYAVNVIGAFQMTRAFVPLLKNSPQAGVVNVSSIAALLGTGSSMAYAASKGALNTLTLTLAQVLGPSIRVNAVAPGLVESPWLRKGLGEGRFEMQKRMYKNKAILDAIISPEDVAATIYWLGVGATKTTGEIQLIDAGRRNSAR